MEYDNDRGYDDEPEYSREGRDRSRSPRPDRHEDEGDRARSVSPNGRDRTDSRGPAPTARENDDESARNTGTNLFVTGIHPRLNEDELARMFGRYGQVEKCQIMRDPHTKESRKFGFVNMVAPEQADAAKEGLNGETINGMTLSIEKARRNRPRTPTPGKYFGPPKRDNFRERGGRYGDRYGDRRGGYERRDDYYRGGYSGSRYDRYDDRGYGRRDRDEYGPRGIDRYSRDDRYGGNRGDDRRGGGGGGGGYYGREDRAPASYGEPAGDAYAAGRPYDDRARGAKPE